MYFENNSNATTNNSINKMMEQLLKNDKISVNTWIELIKIIIITQQNKNTTSMIWYQSYFNKPLLSLLNNSSTVSNNNLFVKIKDIITYLFKDDNNNNGENTILFTTTIGTSVIKSKEFNYSTVTSSFKLFLDELIEQPIALQSTLSIWNKLWFLNFTDSTSTSTSTSDTKMCTIKWHQLQYFIIYYDQLNNKLIKQFIIDLFIGFINYQCNQNNNLKVFQQLISFLFEIQYYCDITIFIYTLIVHLHNWKSTRLQLVIQLENVILNNIKSIYLQDQTITKSNVYNRSILKSVIIPPSTLPIHILLLSFINKNNQIISPSSIVNTQLLLILKLLTPLNYTSSLNIKIDSTTLLNYFRNILINNIDCIEHLFRLIKSQDENIINNLLELILLLINEIPISFWTIDALISINQHINKENNSKIRTNIITITIHIIQQQPHLIKPLLIFLLNYLYSLPVNSTLNSKYQVELIQLITSIIKLNNDLLAWLLNQISINLYTIYNNTISPNLPQLLSSKNDTAVSDTNSIDNSNFSLILANNKINVPNTPTTICNPNVLLLVQQLQNTLSISMDNNFINNIFQSFIFNVQNDHILLLQLRIMFNATIETKSQYKEKLEYIATNTNNQLVKDMCSQIKQQLS